MRHKYFVRICENVPYVWTPASICLMYGTFSIYIYIYVCIYTYEFIPYIQNLFYIHMYIWIFHTSGISIPNNTKENIIAGICIHGQHIGRRCTELVACNFSGKLFGVGFPPSTSTGPTNLNTWIFKQAEYMYARHHLWFALVSGRYYVCYKCIHSRRNLSSVRYT